MAAQGLSPEGYVFITVSPCEETADLWSLATTHCCSDMALINPRGFEIRIRTP